MIEKHPSHRVPSASKVAERVLRFEEVEPRVLFSATSVAPSESGEPEAPELPIHMEKADWVAEETSTVADPHEAENSLLTNLNLHAADLEVGERRELVFLSAGLYDDAYLAQHLDPAFEVYRIEAGTDALGQIAAVVEGRSGIDAIHLIGHGEAGRLFLGGSTLDSASMAGSHGELLQRIGESLSEDSDILIYGCDFAAGDEGRAAVSTIAALTGADVAASTDDTGAVTLGGDWDLEHEEGAIESSSLVLPGFSALLAPPVWSISGSSSVNEGASASYTLSLAGSVQSGTSVSVDLSLIEGTTVPGDHASFVSAVNAAIAGRPELSFNGTTLTYSPPVTYTSTLITSGSNYASISGMAGVNSHNLSDDSFATQNIGFNFDFYGTSYSQLHVGSNGYVTFGGGSTEYTNESFAAGGTIGGRPAIAALWDDWNPGATAGVEVFSIVTGTAGSRQFIVQWSNIVHFGGSQTASFQMVLNESDGSIEFRYLDVDVETSWDFGASATIGVSDGATRFNQFSFETPSIGNNQRIVYSRAVSMSPVTITLGTVNDTTPESSETFQIALANATNSTLGTSSVTTTILDNDAAPPVGVTDAFNANENSGATIVGNALSNDTDPNGDSLTATPATGAGSTGGIFTIAANGQVTFNPNGQFENLGAGQTRVTSFNYTVNDGNGGSTVGVINVTVSGANDAPVAAGVVPTQSSNDGQTITPLNLGAYFSDVDLADTLAFSATGLPPGLSIHPGTGVISGTITSSASTTPIYSVVVTATDGAGANATRSFSWNVSNPAPVAVNNTFTAAENAAGAVVGNVLGNDYDPDGDTISVVPQTAVTGSNGGLFWIAVNGTVTFSPNGAFESLAVGQTQATSVSYTLVDANGATSVATVTVNVTGENDAPATVPALINVNEESTGTPLGIAAPTDIDGDTLTITVTGLPAVGTVKLANGNLVSNGMSLTPAQLTGLRYDAPAELATTTVTTFTYNVSDGYAPAVGGTVTITVNPVNDAPVATPDAFVVDEDASVTIDVLDNDSDVDSGSLSITHVGGLAIVDGGAAVPVTNGLVALSGGVLIFTPDADYHGPVSFNYTVSDGLASTVATVNGTVNEVVEAVTLSHVSTLENGSMVFTATLDRAVAGGFTVEVSTVSGTASSGVDFVALSTTLTFAGTVGEVVTFTVTPIEDSLIEADETFTVVLSNVSNASVNISSTGTGTITDNDARLDPSGPGTGTTTDVELVANGSGGFDLVIEDVETDTAFSSTVGDSDSDDNLLIYRDGADYVIRDAGGLWLGSSVIGSTRGAANEIRVPVSLVTGNLILRTGVGNDVVTLRDLGAALSGGLLVDLEDSSNRYQDTDTIQYDSSTTLASGSNAQFRAETINGLEDAVLAVTGVGTILWDAGRNIFMDGDARLASESGDITLEANLDGVVNGRYRGIVLDGAEIESLSGDVRLEGRGGDQSDRNFGVNLSGGSSIDTGGSLEIVGTGGGDGTEGAQLGVLVTSSDLSATGVTVRGSGGNGTQYAAGVTIEKKSTIDAGTGDLSIFGTGGSTGSNNYGVSVAGSVLESDGGDIRVEGSGAGTNAGFGVRLATTTATTNDSGAITLRGTGSGTGSSNVGVQIQAASRLTAEDGGILVVGSSSGAGTGNYGVNVLGQSILETSAGTGGITLRGTGGTGSKGGGVVVNSGRLTVDDGDLLVQGTGGGPEYGRGVDLTKSTIQSLGAGDIDIDGTGSATGTGRCNTGVFANGSTLTANGTGTIDLRGTGGTGSPTNDGVQLADTRVEGSVSIAIVGVAGGTAGSSTGVAIESGSVVSGTGNASVTLNGSGSLAGASNGRYHRGIEINGSTVSTVNGNLTVSGTGGGAGNGSLNHGIDLVKSNLLASGSGRIILTGDAARGGIGINGSRANIVTASGNLSLTGNGGAGTKGNRGINLMRGEVRSSGGGNITVRGTAHPATTGTGNVGVFIERATVGTSGSFSVFGTGGGGTGKNHGIFLNRLIHSGSGIAATGVKTDGSAKSFARTGDYFA